MGKCIELPGRKVAVSSSNDGGVVIEFFIVTEDEEPLFYHERLEGNVTHTAVKISKNAAKALELLLADHHKVLNDKN